MDVTARICVAIAYGFLSAVWVKQIGGRFSPGFKRLAAVSIVLVLNLFSPFLFGNSNAEIIGRKVLAYFTVWLGSFKVIAYCLNRGPLVDNPEKYGKSWSMVEFAFILMLPILPKPVHMDSDNGNQKIGRVAELGRLGKIYLGKLVCFIGAIYLISNFELRNPLKAWIFAQAMYGFLGLFFDTAAILAVAFIDMKSIDSFNYPFGASSLGDFWGNRWNIMTGKVLKYLSLDLLFQEQLVANASSRMPEKVAGWKMVIGTLSVFALSGVMHEILFWYTLQYWDFRWFLYFFTNGLALLLERFVMAIVRETFGKVHIPHPVAVVYFTFNAVLWGQLFFVTQAENAGSKELATEIQVNFWWGVRWIVRRFINI